MAVRHLDIKLGVVVLWESHCEGTDVAAGLSVTAIEKQHAAARCVTMHPESMAPNFGDELGKNVVGQRRRGCPTARKLVEVKEILDLDRFCMRGTEMCPQMVGSPRVGPQQCVPAGG